MKSPLQRVADLKDRLRAGAPVSACWATFHDPSAMEITATTGFDLVIVDGEHAPWDAITLQSVLMAFKGSRSVPVLRTLSHDGAWIKQALDIGFEGVLIPNIMSGEMAAAVVEAAKYPPDGSRGFGPRRASSYGRDPAYRDTANEALLTLVQIEHRDAVTAVDAILETAGIDAVIVGPNDLSGSFGRLGQLDHPEVVSAIDEVLAAGIRTKTPVGYGVPVSPKEADAMVERGFQILSLAADVGALARGLDATLSGFRSRHENT